MKTLNGEQIYLRALEPEDLDFVHEVENDESLWHLSNTQSPFSRFIIKEYISNAHRDIYEMKQLRLVICDKEDSAIGMIDVFECDFKNQRAGIGILIKDSVNRKKGYGKEALSLLTNYCFSRLNLHQLYCNIYEDNLASISLFKSVGFREVGLKKDWSYYEGKFRNEYLFQLIKK
ncbi:diamine N-acetyltransferase [Flavobacteriaceae bacterium MAR_2010_188]|nr:diamine N-acetyltransferase [Flavobacteriaceae bacterium MAR_2010_188]